MALSAIATCLLLLLGLEWGLRRLGHTPSVTDDPALWAQTWSTIATEPRGVALLGQSRMQSAVDIATLSRELGRPVAQLAKMGRAAVGTLAWIAEETDYAGAVILACTAGSLRPRFRHQQGDLRAAVASTGPAARIERRLTTAVQERLCLAGYHSGLRTLLRGIVVSGALPPAAPTRMSRHRELRMGVREALASLPRQRVQRANDATIEHVEGWRAALREVGIWVQQIQARGGHVLIWHPPLRGKAARDEEARHPKARFWDSIAAATGAQTLHYSELPDLAEIPLHDGMHVDDADRVEFSRRWAAALLTCDLR